MAQDVNATGQCLCGAVHFKVAGPPIWMAQCHCRDCQRASGTGHMSNAIFKLADVEIVGETASYASEADSGATLMRHFCLTCGSRLFSVNSARPWLIIMAVGAFDDTRWFKPQIVLYTKSREAWDHTTDQVPNFEGMPPPPPPKS